MHTFVGPYFLFYEGLEGLFAHFYYKDDYYFEDEGPYRCLCFEIAIRKIVHYRETDSKPWTGPVRVAKDELGRFLKDQLLIPSIVGLCHSDVSFTDIRLGHSSDPLNEYQVLLNAPICGQGGPEGLDGPDLTAAAVLPSLPESLFLEVNAYGSGRYIIQMILKHHSQRNF